MIGATSLKNGTTFLVQKTPYQVVKYSHQKIARGGGVVKVFVRNLVTGALEEKAFNSSARVEDISVLKRTLQFLYQDDNYAFFMDPKNFEQIQIPLKIIKDQVIFIKEGGNIDVCFWEDRALSISLAPSVVLKVVETNPGLRGNSATNIFKPAKLENDLEIKVPLFIKKGDRVKVDTRTKEYIERV